MATREPKKTAAAKPAAAPPAAAPEPAAAAPADDANAEAEQAKTEIALRPEDRVKNQLAKMSTDIMAALGVSDDDTGKRTVERFKRIASTAIVNSPKLMNADRRTLLASCLKCAQDGLVPDGREAALVPFWDKGLRAEAVQYMPMVQGLVKLVMNTGFVASISNEVVKEKDTFELELGDAPRIYHKPALRARGNTIGAYSIVTFVDGTKSRCWMDIDEILAVKSRSKVQDGPWKSDFDQMACKTAFRRHFKTLGRSSEALDRALAADNAFFNYKDVLPASTAGDGPHPEADKLKGEPKKAEKKPAASRMRDVINRRRAPDPEPEPQREEMPGDIIEGHFTQDPGPPPDRFNDDFDDISTSASADDDDGDGAPI